MIFLLEGIGYLVIGMQGAADKWEPVALMAFIGLGLVWCASFLMGTRAEKWIPLVAVGQMLCGVMLVVLTPAVMLTAYLPMAVLHVLLGVCTLFIKADSQEVVNPRLQGGE